MHVVLKELEKLIYIPVSQYKGDVSGNNNKEPESPISNQLCSRLNAAKI